MRQGLVSLGHTSRPPPRQPLRLQLTRELQPTILTLCRGLRVPHPSCALLLNSFLRSLEPLRLRLSQGVPTTAPGMHLPTILLVQVVHLMVAPPRL